MLKQDISYTDLFDPSITKNETHYFNLNEDDISQNLMLHDRLQNMLAILQGEQRELSTVEKQEMVNLVREFIKLSHGVRTETGGFRKTADTFQDFVDSGAHNAFLISLFNDTEKVFEFVLGILPQNVRDQAEKEFTEKTGQIIPLPDTIQPAAAPTVVPVAPEAATRKYEDYTVGELLDLSDEEFFKLVGTKEPLDMTKDQLAVAFQRKNRA